ncbi:MAG: hypothetical protein ACKVP3_01445 [Hyphomicrobiaceae bacterium]
MNLAMRDLTEQEIDGVSGGEIKQIGKCTVAPPFHELKTAIGAFINGLKRIWGSPSTDPWE